MPQCRSDQTKFAIFLLTMVVVETMLIFTLMHREHAAAERLATEKRQLQQQNQQQEWLLPSGANSFNGGVAKLVSANKKIHAPSGLFVFHTKAIQISTRENNGDVSTAKTISKFPFLDRDRL